MIAAGKLDRRLTIRRRTVMRNDYGEEIETWSDLATVPAEKRETRGADRWAAQQVIEEFRDVFVIRYFPGLSAKDRIVVDGLEYEIQPPIELGRREGMEIHATARAE